MVVLLRHRTCVIVAWKLRLWLRLRVEGARGLCRVYHRWMLMHGRWLTSCPRTHHIATRHYWRRRRREVCLPLAIGIYQYIVHLILLLGQSLANAQLMLVQVEHIEGYGRGADGADPMASFTIEEKEVFQVETLQVLAVLSSSWSSHSFQAYGTL